jgi:hypothetical protein
MSASPRRRAWICYYSRRCSGAPHAAVFSTRVFPPGWFTTPCVPTRNPDGDLSKCSVWRNSPPGEYTQQMSPGVAAGKTNSWPVKLDELLGTKSFDVSTPRDSETRQRTLTCHAHLTTVPRQAVTCALRWYVPKRWVGKQKKRENGRQQFADPLLLRK